MTASNLAQILVEVLDVDVVDDLPVQQAAVVSWSADEDEALMELILRNGQRFEITIREAS